MIEKTSQFYIYLAKLSLRVLKYWLETRNATVLYIPVMASDLTFVLLTSIICSELYI